MGLIVETGCGRIEGVEEGGVEVFRGIPYAASAAGAGRWRPPAPREPWPGVRDARRPGPMAPQAPGLISKLLGDSGLAMDEDCLTLDVWTPSADAARRPVLVWIHGGSFNTGSGSLAVYDGGVLALRGGDRLELFLVFWVERSVHTYRIAWSGARRRGWRMVSGDVDPR